MLWLILYGCLILYKSLFWHQNSSDPSRHGPLELWYGIWHQETIFLSSISYRWSVWLRSGEFGGQVNSSSCNAVPDRDVTKSAFHIEWTQRNMNSQQTESLHYLTSTLLNLIRMFQDTLKSRHQWPASDPDQYNNMLMYQKEAMKTLHKLIKDEVFTFNGIMCAFSFLVHRKCEVSAALGQKCVCDYVLFWFY